MISGDKYRVRDRLATADMRLSVQVDVTAANGCYAVQLPPPHHALGSVVHGACRAKIDRVHAQRIVGIASDGDQAFLSKLGFERLWVRVSLAHLRAISSA